MSSLSPLYLSPSDSFSSLLRRHVSPSHSRRPNSIQLRFHVIYPYPLTYRTDASCRRVSSPAGASAALLRDAGATTAVLAGAYGLVLAFDTLTQRDLIDQKLSRKLVHILSGLLFAMSWPIFSTSSEARYFASVVPLVNCLRLVVYGLSLATDEGLIKSVTREGTPEELLRGPLFYVLILILCDIVFWRDSPVGLVSLAMMCGGDGVADIMGRRFGSAKLPFNQQKSWAGSVSMFFCGFLISIGMLYYYSALGYFQLDWIPTVERVALVALVATVVESLPTTELIDDNISVPLMPVYDHHCSVIATLINATHKHCTYFGGSTSILPRYNTTIPEFPLRIV